MDDFARAGWESIAEESSGRSPLLYHRSANVSRQSLDAPVPIHGEVNRQLWSEDRVTGPDSTEYYAPAVVVGRTRTGRPLKAAKRVENPNAAPRSLGFVDWEPVGENDAYIHYANTHQGFRGMGVSERLVRSVANQRSGVIDFGRVMSPHMWRIKEKLEAEGRQTRGKKDF